MRVLVLVIATNKPLCQMQTEYWRRVLTTCPPEIDVRFLYAQSTSTQTVQEDIVSTPKKCLIKTSESFIPGILTKTMSALTYYKNKEDSVPYNWILRTNTSTFIDFPRLLTKLDQLDHSHYYGALVKRSPKFNNQLFAVGFFILFSSATSNKLLTSYNEPQNQSLRKLPDDIALAKLAILNKVNFRTLSNNPIMPHLFPKFKANPSSRIFVIRNRNYEPNEKRIINERGRWEEILNVFRITSESTSMLT